MKVKINIDTMKKINSFVEVCSRLYPPVYLIDGEGFRISAKSILGAIATLDWSQVYVECEQDIYDYIKDFIER